MKDIGKTIEFLFRSGDTFELCAIGKGDRTKLTASGWYKQNGTFDPGQLAPYRNIYVTLNPTTPALEGRSCARLKEGVARTADKDIPILCNLLLDFDPVRPSDTASTDEGHKAALDLAGKVRDYLTSQGWPEPLFGDSGNGASLIYPLEDLENTITNLDLVKNCIAAIGVLFDTDAVKIDRAVFNPSRLVRLYGTVNRKGDSIPERPHRLSKILSMPENRTPVPIKKLRELAGKVQSNNERPEHERNADASRLDVERYLNNYAVEIVKTKQNGTATLTCLKKCVFDPSHAPNEAAIVQADSGALGYQCFHNSCQGRTWSEARKVISGPDSLKPFLVGGNGDKLLDTYNNNPEHDSIKICKSLRVVGIADFLRLELPPRENILNPWLPTQGLAMVYGPRGIGKTHFAMGVAMAVASGGQFLRWAAQKPFSVLYLDGEMPAVVVQERFSRIIVSSDKEPVAALNIVTPDLQERGMPDLSTFQGQETLTPYLDGISAVIVDNISTLCRMGRENESESWSPVQEWGLRLRSKHISVLFVHHSGKGGFQRGTSRREDVLDTVISLKRPGDYLPDEGARFEVHFEKARNIHGDDVKPFEAKLTTVNGSQQWTLKTLEDSLTERVANLLNDGIPQNEIAELLGVAKGTVSKHKHKAQTQGLLKGNQ